MITLYLQRLAARRAYTAAQNRDARVFRAWCNGDRTKGPDGTLLTDVLQGQVVAAWRRVQTTREAWEAELEGL